ncbi:hypothetical protein AGLY_001865 [Aphis glycines]|uniref:Ig-like domain-containing protein n=1 Tax=Aphis glycines TaxID=307491 RepID=A0A6G0U4K2_APHGL|nr:hypothetical protein AGLY_001865 [Aphis glycines]
MDVRFGNICNSEIQQTGIVKAILLKLYCILYDMTCKKQPLHKVREGRLIRQAVSLSDPVAKKTPKIIARAGQQLQMTCPISGYPIFNINWEKDILYLSISENLLNTLISKYTINLYEHYLLNIDRFLNDNRIMVIEQKKNCNILIIISQNVVTYIYIKTEFTIFDLDSKITENTNNGRCPNKPRL